MMRPHHGADGVPKGVRPEVRKDIYNELLEQVHDVAEKSVDRLQRLRERYPFDLPEKVIEALHRSLAYPPDATGAERRCAPRFPDSRETVLISEPRKPRSAHEVTVLDRSWCGLRIHSPRPIKRGTVYEVRRPGSLERPSFAEVRYCCTSADGWEAGCEFLRTG